MATESALSSVILPAITATAGGNFTLETKLSIEGNELSTSPNIAELLSPQDLSNIGNLCWEEFAADLSSRYEWEGRTAAAMKLVMQVFEQKNYPWPGASSVKFPLLTIAAIQYHARAYPGLIVPNDIVRYQVFGDDEQGNRNTLGRLIGKHMTYQLTEVDEGWEDSMDRTLLVQALVGSAFKKVYYSSLKRRNCSELVLPRDLVISYYTPCIEDAPRVTHCIFLSMNDVVERERKEMFLELSARREGTTPDQADTLTTSKDLAQGVTAPIDDASRPFEFCEMHRWLDLDSDGYAEPYIVTFHRASKQVVRIVARYTNSMVEREDGGGEDSGEILSIQAINYFQKYTFIPSPDGGIYDMGLGQLLLSLNESVNTLVNQLIDAGTLQNLGGGFFGRGVRMKGGNAMFSPGEWKPVDSTGDDLRKSILPLPAPQPSPVLFELLAMLINYTERTASASDTMQGQLPGQNTPAETSRNALEQGMMVFNGIFKRTYRALKGEFKKLYLLNSMYLPDKPLKGDPFKMTAGHYLLDPQGIRPAADPNIMSDSQRIFQAKSLIEASSLSPGAGYNVHNLHVRFAEALRIPNIEEVLPDPKGKNAIQPAPNPKLLDSQTKQAMAKVKAGDVKAKHQLAASKLMIEASKVKGIADELRAKATLELAQARDLGDRTKLEALSTQLSVATARHEGLMRAIEVLNGVVETEQESEQQQATEGESADGSAAE